MVFLNGRRWTGRGRPPRNSTIPEHYNAELGIASEVKNWDVSMRYEDMIQNIINQQTGRSISLPQGTRQWLFIDLRQQPLTQFDELAERIRRDLGGSEVFEQIHLITDQGVRAY